jgi:hypothetical protein
MEPNISMSGKIKGKRNAEKSGSAVTATGVGGIVGATSIRDKKDNVQCVVPSSLSSDDQTIRNVNSLSQIQKNATTEAFSVASVSDIPMDADNIPQTESKDDRPEFPLIAQPSSTSIKRSTDPLEEQDLESAKDASDIAKPVWNVFPKSSKSVPKRQRKVFTNLFHDQLENLEEKEEGGKRISIPSPSFIRKKTSGPSGTGGNDIGTLTDLKQPSVINTATLDAKCWTWNSTEPSKAPMMNAAAQPIPRPSMQQQPQPQSKKSSSSLMANNDNFVRLNLRNNAGSCRGARNGKTKSKAKLRYEEQKKERREMWKQQQNQDGNNNNNNSQFDTGSSHQPLKGVDPVDDFVDGVFSSDICTDKQSTTHSAKKRVIPDPIPLCSGHQQPCKLLTVKKSGENRGRKFYVCSYPRREQCDFFQWADDTITAARTQLLRNRSLSGFIARQVASYMERVRSLTVPELKELAKRHGLDTTGNKAALLLRLSIWVRDEVVKGTKELEGHDDDIDDVGICNGDRVGDENGEICDSISVSNEIDSAGESDCSDDDNASSSTEELEVIRESNQTSSLCNSHANSAARNDHCGVGYSDSSTSDPFHCQTEDDESITLTRMLHEFFGHTTFRDGQEWAIRRCINQQRSLLVAPTGFGKSLCFSLTAAMLDGVCIVVSPLLSLIQDQIRLLPARIPSVTLSGQMSTANMVATLDDIMRGRIKLLFVSPERLASSSFRRLFRRKWNSSSHCYERLFPSVSLFCVDEAHCMSQWAHNFRPSYLRLGSIVDIIEPKSVLAITATAGPRVIKDICRSLKIEHGPTIPSGDIEYGVKINRSNRDNIDVRCLMLTSQEERLAKVSDYYLNNEEVWALAHFSHLTLITLPAY